MVGDSIFKYTFAVINRFKTFKLIHDKLISLIHEYIHTKESITNRMRASILKYFNSSPHKLKKITMIFACGERFLIMSSCSCRRRYIYYTFARNVYDFIFFAIPHTWLNDCVRIYALLKMLCNFLITSALFLSPLTI